MDHYDRLQAEFCPPLDTSLLAALIADIDPASSPRKDQLDALRTTLAELARQATAQHDHDELNSPHPSSRCPTTEDSISSPDFCRETTEWSTTSESSAFSQQSFSSPLGFLQAALPHIPPSRLKRAIGKAGTSDEGDVDMESVIEALLTDEYIHELDERGLDARDDDPLWNRVEAKKKSTTGGKTAKKKPARGKTFALADVRQRHHLPSPTSVVPPARDPWTKLSSLSEYLATLLPPHPASLFQSHFHSPSYVSPANALRAALSSIAGTQTKSSPATPTTPTIFTMLDILRDSSAYSSLDPEQRSTLYADAQLALRASHGRGDDAIDIVWLLLELDLDLESGTLAMGVYHFPQSPLSPSRSSAWIPQSPTSPPPPPRSVATDSATAAAATRKLPNGPPPVQPPPTSKRKSFSLPVGPLSPTTDKPQQLEWQTVPEKRSKGPHSLALHIPAHDDENRYRPAGTSKVRGSGNGIGKGGKGDVGELTQPDFRQRIAASLKKRDELLREASKAWRAGNAKTRGGEVAMYFAERARECQESARREALNEARIMVESKRSASADHRTVDLHGTNISEATAIVQEILEREGCSAASPLRIITGRGTHSANGIGVLKPAVRNALVESGWNVGVWDGGLVVRGHTGATSATSAASFVT